MATFPENKLKILSPAEYSNEHVKQSRLSFTIFSGISSTTISKYTS